MKKLTICLLLAVFPMWFTSCVKPDEAASSVPSITIEEPTTDLTSVTFTVKAENASDAAYLLYASDESYEPAAGDIFSNGTRIPADEPSTQTVNDLEPNTSYTIAAVAKNSLGEYSKIATATVSTTPSEGLYSFEVSVSDVTDVTAHVKVTPSDGNASYVVDWVGAGTYEGMTGDEIYAEYYRIFNGTAINSGKDLKDVLAENLSTGVFDETLTELLPLTDYELVVFGMDPEKGFLTSDVQLVPFKTAEQVLTLDVRVENITAKSADVYVYPSNDEDTFIWLCEPVNKYPGMSLEEIAETYTANNKMYLDMYMGLYTGAQEYPGYELMPGVDYYILAYGYEPGVGISTDVEGEFFSALPGGDIETFSAEINITNTQGERIDYTVVPNDETIYYLPGCMKTSEYSDDLVKTDVAEYIKSYWEQNLTYNPAYSIEEAVDVLCYTGTVELYASPLEPETDYTIFAVPVNSKGETGSIVISKQATTPDMGYSDANVTSEYIGAWDAKVLQDAGYFTDQDLTNQYVMAYRITVSPTCETVKIKAWNGQTELTDQELIDIIEPYWDLVYTGEDVDKLKYVYTLTPNYWPGGQTLCTLGFDADGVRAAMGRTYVDVFWEDALLPLEDWEALQSGGSESTTALSAIAPDNKVSETRAATGMQKVMLSPKNSAK